MFFLEVGGLLVDLGESGDGEGLVAGDGGAGEGALPAVFEDPAVGVVPVDGGGEDAAGEVEAARLELEDGQVGEFVAVGVEELVVEDAGGLGIGAGAGGLAGDPLAVGAKEGLGGLAFDGGEKGFLAAVGVGEIGLVEDEEQG